MYMVKLFYLQKGQWKSQMCMFSIGWAVKKTLMHILYEHKNMDVW